MVPAMSTRHARSSRPWLFFAVTLGWSWLFWIPAAFSGRGLDSPVITVMFILGGLGPPLAGVGLTYLTKDREGRRDYWRRVVDFRRIRVRWYAVILLTFPLLMVLAAALDALLGGEAIRLEAAALLFGQPLSFLAFTVFILLFGPLPEELGWRGYALDGLQVRWSALTASLLLGVVWALWHVPQFFIEGTFQSNLGVGTTTFWTFMVQIVASSVLYTWVYNNTGRSTLSAILFHFMENYVGQLFALSEQAEIYYHLFQVGAVVLVVFVWEPETLTHRREPGVNEDHVQ